MRVPQRWPPLTSVRMVSGGGNIKRVRWPLIREARLASSEKAEERYVVRPPRILPALGLAIMVAVAATFFILDESRLWKLTGLTLGLLFLLGFADSMTAFVSLGEHDLTVRSNFRTRRILIVDITKVVRAKGCPIALQMRTGEWYRLPDWCESGIGFQNRIEARVKRAPASDDSGPAAI